MLILRQTLEQTQVWNVLIFQNGANYQKMCFANAQPMLISSNHEDNHNYTHNLGSCETKARKNEGLNRI